MVILSYHKEFNLEELNMSRMSDFSIWFEDVLVSRDWDTDQPEVQILMEKHQGYFMSMYAAGSSENEVVRAFAGFWHNSVPQGAA